MGGMIVEARDSSDSRKGPGAKESRQPLDIERDKETSFLLGPLEGASSANTCL